MTMASAAYVYQRLNGRRGQAVPPDPPGAPAGALIGASN